MAGNGITLQYTLYWTGPGPAPASVTVYYRRSANASASCPNPSYSNSNISCDNASALANSHGVTSQSYTEPAFHQETLSVSNKKATKTFTVQFQCAVTLSGTPSGTGGSNVNCRVDFCVQGYDLGRFPGGDPNHVSGSKKNGASDPTYTRWLPLAFSPQISSQPFRTLAGALPPPWGNINCQYSIALRQEPLTPNTDADNTGRFFQPGPGPDGTYNNPGPPATILPPAFLPQYAFTDANGARLPYDSFFNSGPGIHCRLFTTQDASGNVYYLLTDAGPPGAIGQLGNFTYKFLVTNANPLYARLVSIADTAGNEQDLNWYDAAGGVDGGHPYPLNVYDVTSGRSLYFSKNSAGYFTSVDAPSAAGATTPYTHTAIAYDGNGHATGINVYTGDGLTLLNSDQFVYGGPNGDSVTTSVQGVSQSSFSYIADNTLPDPFGLPIPRLASATYGTNSDTSSSDDGKSVAGTYLYAYPGSLGNTYTVTDPRGNQFFTTLDRDSANGRVRTVAQTGPDYWGSGTTGQNVVSAFYTPDKTQPSQITFINQARLQWNNTYDNVGNLLTASDPNQNTWQFAYTTDQKRLVSATDPTGLAIFFGYGEFPGPSTSLTSITGPVSKITAQYNGYGQPIHVTIPAAFSATGQDEVSSLTYDPTTGDPTLLTNPIGDKTLVTAYDPLGDPLSVSEYPDTGDPTTSLSPLMTSVIYNAAQMPTQINMPNGTNLVTTFQNGVPMQYEAKWQGATLAKVSLSRDSRGRVYAVSDLAGTLANYRYDKNSNLRFVIDGKGNKTSFSYGPNNEYTTVFWPNLMRADFTYNTLGLPATYTNEIGDICQFSYDNLNTLNQVTWQNHPELSKAYAFDALGRLAACGGGGASRTYNYNPSTGRLDSISVNMSPAPITISYTYYPDGKVCSMTTPVGTTNYTYDAAGRLVTLAAPSGTTTYSYDHMGRFLSQNTTTPGGVQLNTSYTWGSTGVPGDPPSAPCYLSNVHQTLNGQMLFNYQLQHTVLGQVLKQTGADNAQHGSSEWYTYDTRGRVTSEIVASNATQGGLNTTYNYDAANNLLPTGNTWVYDNCNQLATAPPTFGLGGGNNLQYDPMGNLTALNNITYGYDAEGHLATVAVSGTPEYSFSYDALGRRIRCINQINQVPNYYLYAGDDLIAEMDAYGHITRSYTWGPLGLISEQEGTDATGLHLFCFDAFGNTRGQVDGTGRLLFQANYSCWGALLGNSGTLTSTPYLWHGQWGAYFDYKTVLHQMGARYYGYSLGRFVSRDPSGFSAGANLYAYCGGDPVNLVDVTGLTPEASDGALWDGIGSAAGNPVSDLLLLGVPSALQGAHDAVANAGTAQGRYDSGKISPAELAGAYGNAAIATGNAALSCYGAYKAVGALSQGACALLQCAGKDGCFVAGTPVWTIQSGSSQALAGVGKTNRESNIKRTALSGGKIGHPICTVANSVLGLVKPIESLKPGDLIYSRNERTGHIEPKQVLRVTRRTVPVVLDVTFASAATDKSVQTLTTTREHPFFVLGKGFVPAGGLAIGNAIVTRAGPPLVVQKVHWRRQANGFVVYNAVVEDDHTYFVGNLNGGLWVHNADCIQPQLPGLEDNPLTGPAEPYDRVQHYGRTPTDAQTASVPNGMSFDHDPPLVQHYYEGDGVGGRPGYEMSQAEREAYARSLSSGKAATLADQASQGGFFKQYSMRMRKKWFGY